MAENNAKNYEGGTKGLGSEKTDVVSPALQKLTELSVKLRVRKRKDAPQKKEEKKRKNF